MHDELECLNTRRLNLESHIQLPNPSDRCLCDVKRFHKHHSQPDSREPNIRYDSSSSPINLRFSLYFHKEPRSALDN